MAHNTTPARRAAVALSTRLVDLDGWHLQVECGTAGCSIGRRHDLRALGKLHAGLTLREAIARMRCGRCQKGVARAALHPWDDTVRWRGPVPVVGPGAYG